MAAAKDRRAVQQRMGRLLDVSTTAVVLGLLYHNPSLVNPWSLSLLEWTIGFTFIRSAVTFYDYLVVKLVEWSGAELLPTRTTGTPVRYVALDRTSLVFLSLNSLNEWVFVQRLCHYLWYSPDVSKSLEDIGLVNTLGALYVIFVVNDVFYAPMHHILHMPAVYPLIHKHHHRQHFPTRGYLDAGNEHPVEHFVGTTCMWVALLTAVHTTGAHAATIFMYFNIHAALAMLNHSPYNVQFGVLGIKYAVENHEMHHRKFTVNYAQYCMWYDHLMGTFSSYEGPSDKKKLENKVSS